MVGVERSGEEMPWEEMPAKMYGEMLGILNEPELLERYSWRDNQAAEVGG